MHFCVINVDRASLIDVHLFVSVREHDLYLMVTGGLGYQPVLNISSLCTDDDTNEQWEPYYTLHSHLFGVVRHIYPSGFHLARSYHLVLWTIMNL